MIEDLMVKGTRWVSGDVEKIKEDALIAAKEKGWNINFKEGDGGVWITRAGNGCKICGEKDPAQFYKDNKSRCKACKHTLKRAYGEEINMALRNQRLMARHWAAS